MGNAALDRVDGGASLDGNYLIYPIYPICPIRPIRPIFPILPVVFVVLFSLPHLACRFSTKAVSDANRNLAIGRCALNTEIVVMRGCRAA